MASLPLSDDSFDGWCTTQQRVGIGFKFRAMGIRVCHDLYIGVLYLLSVIISQLGLWPLLWLLLWR
jgi:hypothetical protein